MPTEKTTDIRHRPDPAPKASAPAVDHGGDTPNLVPPGQSGVGGMPPFRGEGYGLAGNEGRPGYGDQGRGYGDGPYNGHEGLERYDRQAGEPARDEAVASVLRGDPPVNAMSRVDDEVPLPDWGHRPHNESPIHEADDATVIESTLPESAPSGSTRDIAGTRRQVDWGDAATGTRHDRTATPGTSADYAVTRQPVAGEEDPGSAADVVSPPESPSNGR